MKAGKFANDGGTTCDTFFTVNGYRTAKRFIAECDAKRKEVLEAGIDTADETELPTTQDILDDVNEGVGLDEDNEYYNCWGITDHYNSHPLSLVVGEDIILTDE
jgi:hypothetical protein